jgi:pyrroline-5-carboxylate reductase
MKIAFIGGGNMAAAMIGGMLQQHYHPADIAVIEVSAETRERLERELGVQAHATPTLAVPVADLLIMAVKPQQVRAAAKSIAPFLSDQLVITIAAGITTDTLSRWLGNYRNIVRAMPNTPALVRAGITALFAMPEVIATGRKAAGELLGAVGETVWVDDEHQLDAVTALSGSGPAYVFYFLEAMQEAGRKLGLSEATARKLSEQTFLGAAKLAIQSDETPEVLRARVTSKGGTTEAALQAMESSAVKTHLVTAIEAGAARSRELGHELGRIE